MFKNCQSRIRGYLYRAESQIRKGNFLMKCREYLISDLIYFIMFYETFLKVSLYSEFKTLSKSDKTSISQIIEKLKSDLKENDFHGSYFDRGAERKSRICDER